jgi:hypothetical protein
VFSWGKDSKLPYKRKARVLFLDGGSGMAGVAAAIAGEVGGPWLEGLAASLPPDGALLEWADLVVTLDEDAERGCPALPGQVQRRHYPVGDEAALRERISGMVGGMRMMGRG